MKRLRSFLDKIGVHVRPGGKYARLFPLYEALDGFLYTPGTVTAEAPHVRDAMDLKRVMITVVVALIPCFFMAIWNTGFEADRIMELTDGYPSGWRGEILRIFGFNHNQDSFSDNMMMGSVLFFPVMLVTFIVGGFWEALFAIVRKKDINEGFLVTGSLFPLICPPTIPLWQVALGISFGVVIGKEIFGGTGKNFLNPALTGRAFLYFAYPAQNSGDRNWIAVDGYSGATLLSKSADGGMQALVQASDWMSAFLGTIPGSMGETSTLACMFGAAVLILTGVGSWRIMFSVLLGGAVTATLFNLIGSATNPMFAIPFYWHLVLGGFAFGLAFMATDPVSGSMTPEGQWIYGLLIGTLCILIRVVNPAFPEGMMLAILFGNVCAPLIDLVVLKIHIRKRGLRHVQR
ncbi:MAG: NADH:ubiquinone reductase (Na(+)-transporting) subunit B [Deltaproteobacteria bacterium]|nr:NADH:ubiquinone reductase (Na(+)-transporting) subunit B [Deltaproteobacteria bacterium]